MWEWSGGIFANTPVIPAHAGIQNFEPGAPPKHAQHRVGTVGTMPFAEDRKHRG
jgi:hypothetical protein